MWLYLLLELVKILINLFYSSSCWFLQLRKELSEGTKIRHREWRAPCRGEYLSLVTWFRLTIETDCLDAAADEGGCDDWVQLQNEVWSQFTSCCGRWLVHYFRAQDANLRLPFCFSIWNTCWLQFYFWVAKTLNIKILLTSFKLLFREEIFILFAHRSPLFCSEVE